MAKEKDLKPFRASPQQSPEGTIAPQPSTSDDIAWRHFPEFEKMFDGNQMQPMMQRIEKTCKQLDKFIQSGSPEQKSRAQAALTAYGRTLDLVRQLTELRDKTGK